MLLEGEARLLIVQDYCQLQPSGSAPRSLYAQFYYASLSFFRFILTLFHL